MLVLQKINKFDKVISEFLSTKTAQFYDLVILKCPLFLHIKNILL